jgi:S-phase kinase-associated protein 1
MLLRTLVRIIRIRCPRSPCKILAKVIEYCKYHVGNQKSTDDKPATPEDEVKSWDNQDFVRVDQATLFDLIMVMTLTVVLFQSVLM